MATRIQIRRDTSASWVSNNPILQIGEIGFDTTSNRFKIGIGSGPSSRWNALPYLNVIPSELAELAQDAVESAIVAGTGVSKQYNDIANTITISVDDTIANKIYVDAAISGLENDTSETYIPISLFGNADGVATLDEDGHVPSSQISSEIARLSSPTFTGTVSVADLTLSGNLIINGTTTTLNSTTISVDDKNIELGSMDTPSDSTADGGGITLKGTTDKTFNWIDATDAWTSSEHLNLASGKSLYLNGMLLKDATETLTNKTLTSPVINTPTGITKSDVGLANVDNTTDANKPVSTATQTEINKKVDNLYTYVSVAGTSLTLNAASHKYNLINFNSASATILTIPNDTQGPGWEIGSSFEIRQNGDGQVEVQKDAAVTLQSPDNQYKTRVKWSTITIEKVAANTWLMTGDTTA